MSDQPSGSAIQSAPLSIDFLIIGGGIAGLASAVALSRVGHRVVVLERRDVRSSRRAGGMRVPPNLTKILFHWGLESHLREIALTSTPIFFSKFHTGEILGVQMWNAELLKETRGEFMLTTHEELHQLLYEIAISQGVKYRENTEVVEIDPDDAVVKLASGEILTADVIIGADGERGLCRNLLLGHTEVLKPSGLSLFDGTHDTEQIHSVMDKEVDRLASLDNNTVFAVFGNGCGASAHPIHKGRDMSFHIWLPEDNTEGEYGDPEGVKIQHMMPDAVDPRVKLASKDSTSLVRVAVIHHEKLDDWVHDEGRLVVIGQAAHPVPPGNIQAAAVAVEDGAVLAKLFSHLSSHDQIPSFLYAFQDLRQQRCQSVAEGEWGMIALITLPDGPEQEARDAAMKARQAAGRDVLDSDDDGVESSQWTEVRTIFGYDCEDEADDWWQQWGLLRERARDEVADGRGRAQSGAFDWNTMSIQVNSSTS